MKCPSCEREDVGEGRFCRWCNQLLIGPQGVRAASHLRRIGAWLLEPILIVITLFIGYLIWFLIFSRKNGQTPGKQLVGIRAVKTDGSPLGWGMTFVREILVKWIGLSLLAVCTLGVATIVDYLWPFFDRDNQALHDKIAGTLVVDDREYRNRQRARFPM